MNTLDYLRFVISDSVDKSVELNKRSLDVRNSGSEKHERHDQLAIMDSCVSTIIVSRGEWLGRAANFKGSAYCFRS